MPLRISAQQSSSKQRLTAPKTLDLDTSQKVYRSGIWKTAYCYSRARSMFQWSRSSLTHCQLHHDSIASGHPGWWKTYELVQCDSGGCYEVDALFFFSFPFPFLSLFALTLTRTIRYDFVVRRPYSWTNFSPYPFFLPIFTSVDCLIAIDEPLPRLV